MTIAADPTSTQATRPAMVRLLLVDDHELVRAGLRTLVEAEPDFEVVGEAATVAEAVRRALFDQPDVVLLDLDLPDASGLEVCRRLRAFSPASRVLVLTGFADEAALAAAREAGAAGFLLKRIHNLDLVGAIRRVASGGTAFDGAPDSRENVVPNDPLLARLTSRERSILEQIAGGRTNREIADELFLAEKTVKNYVSNLLAKMGTRHRAGAAAFFARVESRADRKYVPSDWVRPFKSVRGRTADATGVARSSIDVDLTELAGDLGA